MNDPAPSEKTGNTPERREPTFLFEDPSVTKSTLSFPDLLNEMTMALTGRPGRTLLTALGTVLGVAALVATLGLTKTAGNQIVSRISQLDATEISVEPRQRPEQGGNQPTQQQTSSIPWDVEDRLERLNGVTAAGSISDVAVSDMTRAVPVIDPLALTEFNIPVKAASPGFFRASRSSLATGRFYDQGHEDRADPVVVIGIDVAEKLGISRVNNGPAIFIGDEAFTVVGILADSEREASLRNAIMVPTSVARETYELAAPAKVLIDIEPGASKLIGAQAATALSPSDPNSLRVRVPAEPKKVRSDIEGDVSSLFLVLGGVSLLVGAVGIANVTLVSVLERTGEIGLRRALGATRKHVALQFLSESVALGLFAGILGASFGIITTVVVSASNQWTPILDPWLPFAAPILGAITGLLAGTYPAWKASSIEPIAALRGQG